MRCALSSSECATKDRRGGDRRSKSESGDEILGHINSYHPQISHYTRSHAPLRRYLPVNITLTMMVQDFNAKHPECQVSYSMYRLVFKKQRITFGNPKQDLCELCISEKIHLKKPHLPGEPACLQCGRFVLHQKYFTICRQFYQRDCTSAAIQDGNTVIYAMDMQRVLLPIMTAKAAFFISRLVYFILYYQFREGDQYNMWNFGARFLDFFRS